MGPKIKKVLYETLNPYLVHFHIHPNYVALLKVFEKLHMVP